MLSKAVLMSIKPKFAEKILSGEKKYEFRRSIFKDKSITKIVLYSSSPVQKVVGEFAIGKILADRPKGLWWRAGIGEDKEFFFDYFHKTRVGFAIEVIKPKKYKKPVNISEYGIKAPRNFRYIWV